MVFPMTNKNMVQKSMKSIQDLYTMRNSHLSTEGSLIPRKFHLMKRKLLRIIKLGPMATSPKSNGTNMFRL